MRIVSVVGARPNFMKVAPLCWALRRWPGFEHLLVHTGQHYDQQMSRRFFHDLDLPVPDINLEVGSGSHAWQTAEVMRRLEPVLLDKVPDVLIVVGDVNSTLAAALTAAKLHIPIAHVEAGLRSFDREMPEEINRQLTDVLSHFLFVTEGSGVRNLRREGADPSRVFLVGNVMIDCLLHYRRVTARSAIRQALGLQTSEGASRPFALLTLHRPSNVDSMDTLGGILRAIQEVAAKMPVLFPVHPRTRSRIEALGYAHDCAGGAGTQGMRLLEPLGYLDFLSLMEDAKIVLTDSGGVQEETTALGVPCLTLRENTERPATVEEGTNQIVGTDPDRIVRAAMAVMRSETRSSRCPPLWDGHAAERIIKILAAHLGVPAAEPELAMSPEAGQRV
ncbi:MAG: non-hydrolyzing UDP-N-acetylglucosamine 2-epimerase [Candidatus Acidiferrales bacterium]